MVKPNTTRSNNFVASFQIEGVCQALRYLVPHGIEPGPAARMLLRSLRDGFVESGTGMTVEHVPKITDDTSAPELLVIAEALRTTMLAFLTPEEAEERGVFGFRPSNG